MEKRLLTTREVAEYFGVDSSTVTQKFIKEGLEYFPVSVKDYRYNEKDVLKFEEQRKKQIQQKNEMLNQSKRLKELRLIKNNECKVY